MSPPGRPALVLGLLLATGAAAAGDARSLPAIVHVAAPAQLRVGAAGDIRLAFRAAHGNVVGILQTIEDLDGPGLLRATRQREFGVVARAFGREVGEVAVPLSFTTPGRKRVTLTLVTDEREESEPAVVEIDALP